MFINVNETYMEKNLKKILKNRSFNEFLNDDATTYSQVSTVHSILVSHDRFKQISEVNLGDTEDICSLYLGHLFAMTPTSKLREVWIRLESGMYDNKKFENDVYTYLNLLNLTSKQKKIITSKFYTLKTPKHYSIFSTSVMHLLEQHVHEHGSNERNIYVRQMKHNLASIVHKKYINRYGFDAKQLCYYILGAMLQLKRIQVETQVLSTYFDRIIVFHKKLVNLTKTRKIYNLPKVGLKEYEGALFRCLFNEENRSIIESFFFFYFTRYIYNHYGKIPAITLNYLDEFVFHPINETNSLHDDLLINIKDTSLKEFRSDIGDRYKLRYWWWLQCLM